MAFPDDLMRCETDAEIIVLGGGLAGCFAASLAEKREKVVPVEKGATKRSGVARL